jgi:hypothetical protein
MKYKDWSDFVAHPTGIYELMSKPKNCTNLNPSQRSRYEKLVAKMADEALTDKEASTFDVFSKKISRFNDPELSAVAIKYLLRRYAFEKYRKRTAAIGVMRATIAKGTELESEAIQLVEELHDSKFEIPTESSRNNYLLGRCDAIDRSRSEIIETKVIWSMDTFMSNYKQLPTKVWYQVQGYMDIYQLRKAQVYYVILNTPIHLLERERAKIWEKYQYGEIDKEKYLEENERFDLAYTVNTIPKKRRFINFEVNYCPEVFSKIYRRVELARIWLAGQEVNHMNAKKIIISNEDYLNIAPTIEENSSEYNPDESHQIDPG